MGGSLMAMAAAAALVGAVTLVPTPAPAGSAAAAPIGAAQFVHHVQFYGEGPPWGDDGWERRRQWREWRREREQRRAWRRAMREQHYGYGPAYGYGHHRGW